MNFAEAIWGSKCWAKVGVDDSLIHTYILEAHMSLRSSRN